MANFLTKIFSNWLPKDENEDEMTKVNPNHLWHIRIKYDNINYNDPRCYDKWDLFNYIVHKRWSQWPYLIHKDDKKVFKDLKSRECKYCEGRVWLYPIPPQDIGVLKSLATQLGFNIKILTFCKHTTCLAGKPSDMIYNKKHLTYIT